MTEANTDFTLSQEFVTAVTSANDPDEVTVNGPPMHVEEAIKYLDNLPKAPKFTPSPNQVLKMSEKGAWQYQIFKLVDEFDPILKTPTFHWDYNDPPGDGRYIGISMVQTMMKHRGLGLAAPQCGLPYRLFVFGSGNYAQAAFNPVIVNKYGEDIVQEGCLSSLGLFLKIKRAAKVDVRYFDWNGKLQEKTFDGLTARVFLHEYDHLDGIMFTSLVSKTVLAHERGKIKSNIRKLRKQVEREEAQLKLQAATQAKIAAVAKEKTLKDAAGGTLPNGTIQLGSSDMGNTLFFNKNE